MSQVTILIKLKHINSQQEGLAVNQNSTELERFGKAAQVFFKKEFIDKAVFPARQRNSSHAGREIVKTEALYLTTFHGFPWANLEEVNISGILRQLEKERRAIQTNNPCTKCTQVEYLAYAYLSSCGNYHKVKVIVNNKVEEKSTNFEKIKN